MMQCCGHSSSRSSTLHMVEVAVLQVWRNVRFDNGHITQASQNPGGQVPCQKSEDCNYGVVRCLAPGIFGQVEW